MYSWLKKYVDPIIPLFSIVPLLSCFALNMVVYSGTMILCDDWYHHDFTSSLDRATPLCRKSGRMKKSSNTPLGR